MDVFSLNYRQLQSEAKKHGIKANQKIDILRLKVKEALNKSSNNLELNSIIVTSTPSIQNSRSSFSNVDMSSSEDIDKILGTNRRNSQFFDDILNFPNNKENINLNDLDNIKENSKEILERNSFHEKDENVPTKQKRELNVTFEMDEIDKKESKITEEQRKCVSVERKTTISCKNVDGIIEIRSKSNQNNHHHRKNEIEKHYLKTAASHHKMINNNINNNCYKKTNNFLDDKTNYFSKPQKQPQQQYKLLNKCVPLADNSKLIKHPANNIRKSNFVVVSKNFCANPPIYQKKIARPSLLQINNKSSRNTICGLTKKII